MNLEYKDKYLKYKAKYINLKNQIGGQDKKKFAISKEYENKIKRLYQFWDIHLVSDFNLANSKFSYIKNNSRVKYDEIIPNKPLTDILTKRTMFSYNSFNIISTKTRKPIKVKVGVPYTPARYATYLKNKIHDLIYEYIYVNERRVLIRTFEKTRIKKTDEMLEEYLNKKFSPYLEDVKKPDNEKQFAISINDDGTFKYLTEDYIKKSTAYDSINKLIGWVKYKCTSRDKKGRCKWIGPEFKKDIPELEEYKKFRNAWSGI